MRCAETHSSGVTALAADVPVCAASVADLTAERYAKAKETCLGKKVASARPLGCSRSVHHLQKPRAVRRHQERGFHPDMKGNHRLKISVIDELGGPFRAERAQGGGHRRTCLHKLVEPVDNGARPGLPLQEHYVPILFDLNPQNLNKFSDRLLEKG